ncbi:MAG: hypothetical protein C4541_01585 [Candidatus Auribacter fodinae]|uniref:Calcineurin-like phosphoesterase domain-containing protein n=1 Tax=Candidatus Auribacter fodinae TaxID=2093366 RepID=A0A3A4R9A3_9BACT|nr:MAG: hypothetical protein C4541_01585 [Candidatus Auribacter fodinae]
MRKTKFLMTLITAVAVTLFVTQPYCLEAEKDTTIPALLNALPEKYGSVRNIHLDDPSAPWVIHIKDYHCQPDLQRNISSILAFINSRYEEQIPICVEGAAGLLDTAPLASIPDPEIRNDVFNYFLKKGKLSGAEYYSVTANTEQLITGIDDIELYHKSYGLYQSILQGYDAFKQHSGHIDTLCDSIKATKFSPENRALIECGIQLLEKHVSFEDFIIGTEQYWSKKPLSDEFKPIEDYARALHRKNVLSPERLVTLSQKLFQIFMGTVDAGASEPILDSYLKLQLGEVSDLQFITQLVTAAKNASIFTDEYSELEQCADLYQTFSSFDKKELFNLCQKLCSFLQEEVLSEDEQSYAQALSTWIAVKQLISLEIPRDHFTGRISIADNDINKFISVIMTVHKENESVEQPFETYNFIAGLQDLIKQSNDFYTYSLERDNRMVSNALSTLTESQSRAVYIITGGFHTDGIIAELQKSHYNYAVIEPVITQQDNTNYYREIMLGEEPSILPLTAENRLAPQSRLANLLGDEILAKNLFKEALLLTKLLVITRTPELRRELLEMARGKYFSFNENGMETLGEFYEKWTTQYEAILKTQKRKLTPKARQDFMSLLRDLVSVYEIKMEKQAPTLGVSVTDASGKELSLRVTVSEQTVLAETFAEDLPEGGFLQKEQLGPTTFYFHKTAKSKKTGTAAQLADTANPIRRLIAQISQIKKIAAQDPFNPRYTSHINHRLTKLSHFLTYAAKKEAKAGNKAQSLLLRANAALFMGRTHTAAALFQEYLAELPLAERNQADVYFTRGTIIRGQKISETITDSSGRPFVDRFGRDMKAHIVDDALLFGSQPSLVVKQRLLDLADSLEEQNEYQAAVLRHAAENLTSSSKNYHHKEIDVTLFTRNGPQAYHESMLGSSRSSYGAYSDKRTNAAEVKNMPPRISYIYDKEITDKMQRDGTLRILDSDAGLATAPIPPEAIKGLIVNRQHVADAIAVLAQYPERIIPLMDTDGNLVWQNADLDEIIEKYADDYASFQERPRKQEELVYAKKVTNPTKLIAIGDLHSDYKALIETLKAASVITEVIEGQYAFIATPGTAIVINGDFLDKGTGADQKRMVDLLMKFQQLAKDMQIEFIVNMGNHEATFLSGEWFPETTNHMYDFLSAIGLNREESDVLRNALKANDIYRLGVFRATHPETMKYIDFLWNLPIVSQVGGHVFIHGGPTEYFNKLLSKTLLSHPEWDVETAIDRIFHSVISRDGFNSAFFQMNFDSILTAAPAYERAKHLDNPAIAAEFLSFFDSARLIGVGHNKALGILGTNKPLDEIHRIGKGSNIVKLDVGTNGVINQGRDRKVYAKAYIVDPKEVNFVFSLSQEGDRISLQQDDDSRFLLLNTDAAFLHDIILSNASPQELVKTQKPQQEIPEEMVAFLRRVFTVYADEPAIQRMAFTDGVFTFIDRYNPDQIQQRLTNYSKEPLIHDMFKIFLTYVDEITQQTINKEDVTLENFWYFYRKNSTFYRTSRSNPQVVTKSIGNYVAHERDFKQFYASMDNSDIKELSSEIILALQVLIQSKYDAYTQSVSAGIQDPRKAQYLLRAKYYLEKINEIVNIKTMRPRDGNPAIFLNADGTGIMGFVHNRKIFLSQPLVSHLWNSFLTTKNEAYLDRLLALVVHELHEYNENREFTIEEQKVRHEESEELEALICGKGNTGSMLDDEIDMLISDWIGKNSDLKAMTIQKFLISFGTYLRKNGKISQYQSVFTFTGIPLEAASTTDLNVAAMMYDRMTERYPEQLFNAIISASKVPTNLFFLLEQWRFSQKELLLLVDLLHAPAAQQTVQAVPNIFSRDDIAGQEPAPAPRSIKQDTMSRTAVGSSI